MSATTGAGSSLGAGVNLLDPTGPTGGVPSSVGNPFFFQGRRWDDDAGHWRLVSWFDDVGTAATGAPGDAAVEYVSWGYIKFQYTPGS